MANTPLMFNQSPWQPALAALFGGLSAAGQPGGWQNFGAGTTAGAQNFQQQQAGQQAMALRAQQIQQQQAEFERQAKADAEAEQRKAMIAKILGGAQPQQPPAPYHVGGAGSGPSNFQPGVQTAGGVAPQSAILNGMSADQAALFSQYAKIDPEGAFAMRMQQEFAKQPEPIKGIEVAGQLINPQTGETIRDLTAEEIKLRQASRPVTEVNMPKQESSYATEYGKIQAGEAGKITPAADKARAGLDQINALKHSLAQMQAAGSDPGRWTPLLTELSAYAQAAGFDPKDLNLPANAGPAEQASAILNKLALGNIGADQGGLPANNFTEADRKFVTEISGTIANTPQGLGAKIDLAERVNQRNVDAETLWNSGRYDQATEAGYRQFKKDWADYVRTHPLYTAEEKQALSALKGASDGATVPELPPGNWQ